MKPSPNRFRTSRTFDLIFLLLFGVVIWQTYIHRIAVGDWIYFRTYEPSPQVIALADRAELTAEGRRLLYRGNPKIITNKAERTSLCGGDTLGCITKKNQIIIYSPDDDKDEQLVTAAHEMLHLAYRRFDKTMKLDLDSQVESELARLQGSRELRIKLRGYTGEVRQDEAHSYLGTEFSPLSPELEQHYMRYFTNRNAIVNASNK